MKIKYDEEALEFIGKLSEGGMRDAITMLDKCLSLSSKLTVDSIVKALGVADYDTMMDLVSNIVQCDSKCIIKDIEDVHSSGKDLKQFVKQLLNFVLDIKKYIIFKSFEYIQIPYSDSMEEFLETMSKEYDKIGDLLDLLIRINTEIKYDSSPKYMIEAMLIGGSTE